MGRACLLRECAGRNSVPLWDLTDAGTNNEGTWKLQWDYDRFGNRVNQELIGGVGFSAFQPQLNISATTNRITDTGYTYDPAGNMTADAQYTYTYDAENRMTSVDGSAATYVYDANGLRVRKTSGTTDTYYVFSGSKLIGEYDVVGGQTTHIREYVYSGSQLVATLASDGQGGSTEITYHHLDHLSVRLNSDASGALVGEQSHLPFGDPWYESGTKITKWRFTTYEHDGESDNDYAVFRFHMYRVGRFASPDPLGGNIADPQTLNRYSYVRNDPGTFVDPLGRDLCWNVECNSGGPGIADFLAFMGGGMFTDPPLCVRGKACPPPKEPPCGRDDSGEPKPCPGDPPTPDQSSWSRFVCVVFRTCGPNLPPTHREDPGGGGGGTPGQQHPNPQAARACADRAGADVRASTTAETPSFLDELLKTAFFEGAGHFLAHVTGVTSFGWLGPADSVATVVTGTYSAARDVGNGSDTLSQYNRAIGMCEYTFGPIPPFHQ